MSDIWIEDERIFILKMDMKNLSKSHLGIMMIAILNGTLIIKP